MTKHHFIGIADAIREHNRIAKINGTAKFDHQHLETLADFFKGINPAFKRSRWLGYICGANSPNGGKYGVMSGRFDSSKPNQANTPKSQCKDCCDDPTCCPGHDGPHGYDNSVNH